MLHGAAWCRISETNEIFQLSTDVFLIHILMCLLASEVSAFSRCWQYYTNKHKNIWMGKSSVQSLKYCSEFNHNTKNDIILYLFGTCIVYYKIASSRTQYYQFKLILVDIVVNIHYLMSIIWYFNIHFWPIPKAKILPTETMWSTNTTYQWCSVGI